MADDASSTPRDDASIVPRAAATFTRGEIVVHHIWGETDGSRRGSIPVEMKPLVAYHGSKFTTWAKCNSAANGATNEWVEYARMW